MLHSMLGRGGRADRRQQTEPPPAVQRTLQLKHLHLAMILLKREILTLIRRIGHAEDDQARVVAVDDQAALLQALRRESRRCTLAREETHPKIAVHDHQGQMMQKGGRQQAEVEVIIVDGSLVALVAIEVMDQVKSWVQLQPRTRKRGQPLQRDPASRKCSAATRLRRRTREYQLLTTGLFETLVVKLLSCDRFPV